MDAYAATCRAVADTVRAEVLPLVDAGDADLVLDTDDGSYELTPRNPNACRVTIYVQSEHEVSLWPTAPHTTRAPTVDIYDRDLAGLLSSLRGYIAAIVAGRVELTLRTGGSAGQCRLWLDDGECRTHLYNVWFKRGVGRGRRWELFRPEPYSAPA